LIIFFVLSFTFTKSFSLHERRINVQVRNQIQAGSCAVNQTCKLLGESCTKENCALGLRCYFGNCSTDNIGGSCNSSSDCFAFGSPSMSCSQGTCKAALACGDKCESSEDCAGNMNCSHGVCQGFSAGLPCNPSLYSADCAYGLYCNHSNLCSLWLIEGASCNDTCGDPELVCSSFKCTFIYETSANAVCDFDTECQEGYACIQNKCQASTVYQNCSSSTICVNSECQCSPSTGAEVCMSNQQPSMCVQAAKNYWFCVSEYNCYPTALDSPDTCVNSHCMYQFETYTGCLCQAQLAWNGNCVYSPYCTVNSRITDFQWTLISVGAVVFVTGVAITGFFIYFKRQHTTYQRL